MWKYDILTVIIWPITCEYIKNLRVMLKHRLRPVWKRSCVRELTYLVSVELLWHLICISGFMQTEIYMWEQSLGTGSSGKQFIIKQEKFLHQSVNLYTVTDYVTRGARAHTQKLIRELQGWKGWPKINLLPWNTRYFNLKFFRQIQSPIIS